MLAEMRGITKTFGEVVAVDKVDLSLQARQVVALLGENGAGKTTLMNILSGLYHADSGDILIDDRPTKITSPKVALDNGIVMVHQHFELIPNFTVFENIILGSGKSDGGLGREKILTLAKENGLMVNLYRRVKTLPVGLRQKAEILKVLCRNPRILILDEPTSNLTPQEVDAFLTTIRGLAERGLAVAFITHKVKEALAVAERVAVLRDGRKVGECAARDISTSKLVELMMGEKESAPTSLVMIPQNKMREMQETSNVILEISNLSTHGTKDMIPLVDVSVTLCEGEILGIAGVSGNGQRELAEAIVMQRKFGKGKVKILNRDAAELDTRTRMKMGVRYIPEDRIGDGLLPNLDLADNLILGHHRSAPYSSKIIINQKAIADAAAKALHEFRISAPPGTKKAGILSGGNIQKLLVGRVFMTPIKLLVAHNPTRGLDIRTTSLVLNALMIQKKEGAGIIFISEDLDELMEVCDRIAVLYNGRIAGILDANQFDRYLIGSMMSGREIAG